MLEIIYQQAAHIRKNRKLLKQATWHSYGVRIQANSELQTFHSSGVEKIIVARVSKIIRHGELPKLYRRQ
jgi:hypothetical protein